MNIKFHNYLDRFPENLVQFSEEQEEIFYRDIKTMGIRVDG